MDISRTVKRFLRHIRYQSRRGTLPLRRSGFSCFSEEEVLERYIAELLPADHCRTAVDIGAGDGRTGSNTLALFKRGWKGVGLERDSRKIYKLAKIYQHLPDVSLCRISVTPYNVLPLLEAYAIERSFSVLNVDIDSYDYWVLDAILTRYRPSIVITEINEKIPPPIKFRVKYDPNFQLREHFYGYSIACLEELCAHRGYALIDLEYNNAFLAPTELAGARALTTEAAYRQGYLERADRREKFQRNENMEILHSVCPEEGMRFIRQFFSQLAGKYELSIAAAPKDVQTQKNSSPTHVADPVSIGRNQH
ncbi:MAG TPA: hypothetical protein VF666_05875 [Pyrinomonadaceae bacterium]|jgi:hypothetical protein